MKLLEEFWYGNLHPGQRDMKPDSPMGKASKRLASCEDKLEALLSDEAKVVFERLQTNQRELLCLSETEAFVLGYKPGAKTRCQFGKGHRCGTRPSRAWSPSAHAARKACRKGYEERELTDNANQFGGSG